MPYTPIHCSVAYLARRFWPGLSLPALLVSVMAPDLEIPFVYVLTSGRYDRLVLHSLLGSVTLAVPLSVVLVVLVYSPLVSRFLKIECRMVKDRCRLSWGMVVTCVGGCLSHVLIDSLHHEYNPLLYPFTVSSFDAFVLWNDWVLASVVVQTVFLVLLVLSVAVEVRKGSRGIWERLLVE